MIKIRVMSKAGEGKSAIAAVISTWLNLYQIPNIIVDSGGHSAGELVVEHQTNHTAESQLIKRLVAISNRIKASGERVGIVTQQYATRPHPTTDTAQNLMEHVSRHQALHTALDELYADFLLHHKGTDKRLGNTTVQELMEWSSLQTGVPDL